MPVSKRVRVSEPARSPQQTNATKLVSDVYDLLLQSSRKELVHLLAVLVKGAPASVLQQVHTEALRIGAVVAEVRAPFQLCSQPILNGIFSFFNEKELRRLPVVCRRWKSACADNAGWTAAIGRASVNDRTLRQLAIRRISWTQPR